MTKPKVIKNADGSKSVILAADDYKGLRDLSTIKMGIGQVITDTDLLSSVAGREYIDPFEPLFYSPEITRETLKGATTKSFISLAIAYSRDPIVSRVLKTYVEYSLTNIVNVCPNAKIKNYYDSWYRDVGVDEVLEWFFAEFYTSGNVHILKLKVDYKPKTFLGKVKNILKNKKIPAAYTILNPTRITAKGATGFGLANLIYSIDSEAKKRIAEEGKGLPKDFYDQAIKSTEIKLNPSYMSSIYYHKKPYQEYAEPMIMGAFKSLHYKNKLRELDLGIIEAGRHSIYKITVGDKDHIPSKGDITSIVNAFKNPAPDLTVFWNYTLKIEIITRDLKMLEGDKYEPVNRDIIAELGVTPRLIGIPEGKGGVQSETVSLRGFKRRLEYGQLKAKQWLVKEYEDIAEAMSFKIYPNPMFRPPLILEPMERSKSLMMMEKRNIISGELAWEELQWLHQLASSYEIEQERLGQKSASKPVPEKEEPGRPDDKPGKQEYPSKRKERERKEEI